MTAEKKQSDLAPTNTSFDILIVKDNPTDIQLIETLLNESDFGDSIISYEYTLKGAMRALGQIIFDVILLDLNLRDSEGLQTLKNLLAVHPKANVIVFIETEDAHLGIQALQLGAQECLVKDSFSAYYLGWTLRYIIKRNQFALNLEELYEQIQSQFTRGYDSGKRRFDMPHIFEVGSFVPVPKPPPSKTRSQRLEIPGSDRAERIQRHIRKSDL